ncbi:MAG: MaoC family dehydratase [Desulfobacterales bacterium]|nr:MaoC family dehydratase [Desulfobacterales bacterium]
MQPSSNKSTLNFSRKPSPWATVLYSFAGISLNFDESDFSKIKALWTDVSNDKIHLTKYSNICNIETDNNFPVFYQMTRIFPLIMRVLGHKKAPLSVVKTLNTRETIYVGRPIDISEKADISCELTNLRFVKNGFETDIIGRVIVGGKTVFKTTKTFLYRGKVNKNIQNYTTKMDEIGKENKVSRFIIPGKAGFSFGFLSGDTNPIHYLSGYAKMQGFERDFAQPILTMEFCMSRLKTSGILGLYEQNPYEINIQYKGPVYYDTEICLFSEKSVKGHRIDLYCGDNERPSIIFEIKQ